MLPFRHNGRSNATGVSAGAFSKKWDRPNQSGFSSNESNSNFYIPPIVNYHYNHAPPPLSDFRQRGQIQQFQHVEYYTAPPLYYQQPKPSSPAFTPLDQVLTETRRGCDATWNLDRKKKSNLLQLHGKRVAYGLLVLVFFGFAAYRVVGLYQNEAATSQLKVKEAIPVLGDLHEQILAKSGMSAENMNDSNMAEPSTDQVAGQPDPLKEYIVYSINEDFETTIEVIE